MPLPLSFPERFEGKTPLVGKVRGVARRWETVVQLRVKAARGRTVTMLFVRELNVQKCVYLHKEGRLHLDSPSFFRKAIFAYDL